MISSFPVVKSADYRIGESELISSDRPAISRRSTRRLSGFVNRERACLNRNGMVERRKDVLRLLEELKRRRKAGYIPAGAFVNAYLGLGDNEQAFYWFEQALKEQSNILQFLKTHPYFDPIRSDPRFDELVRRVGLG